MILNLAKIDFCPSEGGGGKPAVVESISITENGTYTPDTGVDGFAPVVVDVQPVLEQKTITENGKYVPEEGVDGWNEIDVEVPAKVYEKTITENGEFTPDEGYDGFSKVNVEVPQKEEIDLNWHIIENGPMTFNAPVDKTYKKVVLDVDVPQQVEGYTLRTMLESGITDENIYDASVLSVRRYAMQSNSYIRTLNLPNCSNISGAAFMGCSNLQIVELPNAEKIGGTEYDDANAFRSCTLLQNVNIPNVSFIGASAFQSCYSLQTVNMYSVKEIQTSAFNDCRNLKSVDIPIVEIINNNAFGRCSLITSLSIPYVRSIGASAFSSCSSLSEITVGTEYYLVPTLGNSNAFSNTPMVNSTYLGYYGSIYVPAALESEYKSATNWIYYSNRIVGIGSPTDYILKVVDNTLLGRYSVLSRSDILNLKINATSDIYYINLPNANISDTVFQNYSKIQSVDLLNANYVGSYAFSNCANLNTVNIPNVSIIYNNAFNNCSALQTINMSNVMEIGHDAFFNCKFQTLNLPKVSYLDYNAFNTCKLLEEVNLPQVSYLGNSAFKGCSSLSKITIGTDLSTLVSLGTNVFSNTPMVNSTYLGYYGSIYVPASLVDAYKTASGDWYQWRDRIFPIPE